MKDIEEMNNQNNRGPRMVKPNVAVAMVGSRMHYAVPKMLHQAGMLERFYTDAYIGDKPILERALRFIPNKNMPLMLKKFLMRKEPDIPANKVVSFDIFGIHFLMKMRRLTNVERAYHYFANKMKQFNELIISRGLGDSNVVFGFDGASLELFLYAKKRGLVCMLEQSIAPIRVQIQLLFEELERWPAWEYELFLPEDKHPFIEREEAEWELADVVLTGSDFVTEGLVSCGVEGGKCVRVPYGVNLETFSYRVREKRNDGKLRILFVGQVGLRKGIPYLLRALEMIGEKHIAVKIAGKICVSNKVIDRYRASHDFLGEVPRSEIPDLYSWADVFVIPSLCEGSATVTYEALASGVPVIATPNTGSLVRDGIDGQIVPIRDPEAIASAIEKYISEPKLLEEHRRAAQGDRWRCGLDAYRKRLLEAISGYDRE